MIIVERIADGRRRFFPADGKVTGVLLRRGSRERGLEAARDYEIETGGVSLRRVPSAGDMVVILIGERSRKIKEEKTPAGSQIAPVAAVPVPAPLPAPAAPPVDPAPPTPLERAIEQATADGDLEMVKDLLTLAARDHCERSERTAEWQDEFARLTAVMRAAEDMDGITAAFAGIEQFLLGGTQ